MKKHRKDVVKRKEHKMPVNAMFRILADKFSTKYNKYIFKKVEFKL